jgi:hypothetical protein
MLKLIMVLSSLAVIVVTGMGLYAIPNEMDTWVSSDYLLVIAGLILIGRIAKGFDGQDNQKEPELP